MSEFLKPILRALGHVVEPLQETVEHRDELQLLLYRYGWDAAVNPSDVDAVRSAFAIVRPIQDLIEKIDLLINSNQDKIQIAKDTFPIAKDLISHIKNLSSVVSAGLPFPFNQSIFWQELGKHLFDDLVSLYLESHQPVIYAFLHFNGIVQYREIQPTGMGRIDYTRTDINWEHLAAFFSDPGNHLNDLYSWDVPGEDFEHDDMLKVLERIGLAFGLSATRLIPQESMVNNYLSANSVEQFGIRQLRWPLIEGISPGDNSFWSMAFHVLPVPNPTGSAGKPTGILITPDINMGASLTIPFGNDIALTATGALDTKDPLVAKIYPDHTDFETRLGGTEILGRMALVGNPDTPWILLGGENSHRLELSGFLAEYKIEGNLSDPEFQFRVGTGELSGKNPAQLRAVIQMGEGDGFLQEVIGDEPIEINFSANLLWSSEHGFMFEGQVGFEVALGLHLELGPLALNRLYLSLKGRLQPNGQNGMACEVGVGIGLNLGPLALVVENVGFALVLESKAQSDEPGVFGNLGLEFGFKTPNGIGLSIDSGVVKGGGYLFIDADKGEYAGVAELTIQEVVSVKAIAIITTRLPSGEDGYSFLLLITAEFTPIQLGYGFTLNGVGGLIAINRSMNLEAVREGVRDDSISSIMFPDDPVANAPRIIADLNTIFPITVGQYSFGLMGIIGWGTPTLISIELGLMIQIPDPVRVALIGIIKSILPTEEASVLKLQVNFAGTFDSEAKLITFDASLFDSRLLAFTLSGDMAFRFAYGDNPNFVITVGGFHPDYQPPALALPELRRLSINLLGGDNPRLTLATYFAVTSNTVQFGASIDFLFKISKFKVVGFLGFDALFQFSPFYFKVSIAARLAVKLGSETILGISISGMLEGPTPWHIQGTGKFKIFIFKFSVKFDKTFGDRQIDTLPSIDALPLLKEALAAAANWQASLPKNSSLLVTLRKLEEDGLIAHPNSKLSVSQNKVPIDLKMDKIGNRKLSGHRKFSLRLTDANDIAMGKADIKDFFAPAQYRDFKDEEKLGSRAFEKYNSGIKAKSTDALVSDDYLEREVTYERKIMDTRYTVRKIRDKRIDASNYNTWINGTAVSKSLLGRERSINVLEIDRNVRVNQSQYAVVSTETLQVHSELRADSQAGALTLLQNTIENDPAREGTLQVMPIHEIV